MQPNPRLNIAIIGGGISGITTAVILRLVGYHTVLYTRIVPSHDSDSYRPAEFATPHAAASVLPHSVASPNVAHWTRISQEFFRILGFRACCGVRSQVHYEIFEDPVPELPAYANSVENFELLRSEALEERWVPRRSDARQTYGWKFDAFFCEAPDYVRFLFAFYADIGGQIRDVPGDGSLVNYMELNHDIYVNCTGIGAHSFLASAIKDKRCADAPVAPDFEPLMDPFPAKLIRGHYLRLDIKQVVTGYRGQFFSYNYKPPREIYQTATGSPADVYCYPRSDAWILGGSRQQGSLDETGNWIGEQTVGEQIAFPRPDAPPLMVPAPVLKLNADILLRLTDGKVDLERLVKDDPTIVVPAIGYRFVRDSESDSVRVGCSRVTFSGAEKFILHNYGHGGSGFTLSWGCAFDVTRLLGRLMEQPPGPTAATRKKFAIGSEATRRLLVDLLAQLRAGSE